MGEFNDSGGTGVVWNRAGNSGQLFADVGGFGRNRIYFVGDTSANLAISFIVAILYTLFSKISFYIILVNIYQLFFYFNT